jgi:AraC-like DNA-binding protein
MPDSPRLSRAEQLAFLDELEPGAHFTQLFGCLPDTNYFLKDAQGRFILVDPGFVAMLTRSSAEEVLGLTDFDFFPKEVAEKYVLDDQIVMSTGEPLRDLIEPVPDEDLIFHWWVAHKVPLRDRAGRIVGLAGITTRLSDQNAPTWQGPGLVSVLQLIGREYRTHLSVADLARKAGMSVRSLERTFLRKFQTTPLRYLNRVRTQAARHALIHSEKELSTIAVECGFYDQSHMTTHFKRSFGKSPSRYRREHRAA